MNLFNIVLLSCISLLSTVTAVEPEAVYDGGLGNGNVDLRIGTGGAGQSGLVKGESFNEFLISFTNGQILSSALANTFIQESVKNGTPPFKVAWYKSDTTISINYLKTGTVDVGITYSPTAEKIAIDQGIATSPSYYAFRDHFILVGPPENPANISESSDIFEIFSKLHASAEAADTNPPTRFLSRFDKSATNIKESEFWIGIGQVPWAIPYSTWYHQYIAYPIQALTTTILLKEHTITDRGTFLSISQDLQRQTKIYKAATDNADDPLLNPAHLLIGARATNKQKARLFADWLVSPDGGQKVIVNFKKNGEQLYSPAPSSTNKKRREG
ncbi:hypothetical protein FQN57_007155 [Myotisia sp. PD_48]|nr:hypothetical protein FQN57_007155 [Myotisia sp. PD_48]